MNPATTLRFKVAKGKRQARSTTTAQIYIMYRHLNNISVFKTYHRVVFRNMQKMIKKRHGRNNNLQIFSNKCKCIKTKIKLKMN